MSTPYNNPLDHLNEQDTLLYLTPTNSIRAKITGIIGSSPTVYKVQVTWGQGSYFDCRISPLNAVGESPDIWIDTHLDNGWDEYSHSDLVANPGVKGHPILNGDRSRVGWPSRVYARIWNDGDTPRKGVHVKFR